MTVAARVQGFRFAVLAALGLTPIAACGGETDETPSSGTGGAAEGGRAATGGRRATGGRSEGAGGSVATGGRMTAGAGGDSAGAGGTFAGAGGEGPDDPHPRPCVVPAELTAPRPPGDVPATPPFVLCSGDWRHREYVAECPSALPREGAVPPQGSDDTCTSDVDCDEGSNGYCAALGLEPDAFNVCQYGCTTDADCGDGKICECGELIGTCVPATCASDADCADGMLCASYSREPDCGGRAYACQSPDDRCTSDEDCSDNDACSLVNDRRECVPVTCSVGRPFLIDGRERLAAAVARDGWADAELMPDTRGLSAATRARLARAWTEIGLMEHASIAAFARFTLELVAYGVPAELVADSSRAMSDETRHAKQAFALASAYAGARVGPGPLPIGGSLDDLELVHSAVNTLLEGCIGESAAALEAREAAELATDPVVRRVLEAVARDEAEHALLAFRFVRWAVASRAADVLPALQAALDRELRRAAHAAHTALDDDDPALVAHGVVSDARRRDLRATVLDQIVAPALEALAVELERREDAQRVTTSSVVA